MSKREEAIKTIGGSIIEGFENYDDYSIEYDEFGLDYAGIDVSFYCEYGNSGCDVEASIYWGSSGEAEIECRLYGCEGKREKVYKKLTRLSEAVQDYVIKNFDDDGLLDSIEEDYRDFTMDEWQQHGFRDAADYYSYRYG